MQDFPQKSSDLVCLELQGWDSDVDTPLTAAVVLMKLLSDLLSFRLPSPPYQAATTQDPFFRGSYKYTADVIVFLDS